MTINTTIKNIFRTILLTSFLIGFTSSCTTFGTFAEDQSIESKVNTLLEPIEENNKPAFIGVESHNLYVLIYGQVPTQDIIEQVNHAIQGIPAPASDSVAASIAA